MQNTTIEEQVAILEIQVTEIEEDVVDIREDIMVIDEDVADLDQDVNFLFDEQVIQEERPFQLETESGEIQDDIVSKFSESN